MGCSLHRVEIQNSNYSNSLAYHTYPLTSQIATRMEIESTFLYIQNHFEITLAAIKYLGETVYVINLLYLKCNRVLKCYQTMEEVKCEFGLWRFIDKWYNKFHIVFITFFAFTKCTFRAEYESLVQTVQFQIMYRLQ